MEEIWKPIRNIELLEGFSASSKGRIRCDKGYKKKGAKRYTYIMEQHLEDSMDKCDTYILYKRKKFWVKRLVANAFGLVGTKEKYILKHIDINPWNNAPDNLIYVDTCTNFALIRLEPKKIDLEDKELQKEIEEVRYELHEFLSYRKRSRNNPETRYTYKPKHPLGNNFTSLLFPNLKYDYDSYDDYDNDFIDEDDGFFDDGYKMNPYDGDF